MFDEEEHQRQRSKAKQYISINALKNAAWRDNEYQTRMNAGARRGSESTVAKSPAAKASAYQRGRIREKQNGNDSSNSIVAAAQRAGMAAKNKRRRRMAAWRKSINGAAYRHYKLARLERRLRRLGISNGRRKAKKAKRK